MAAYSTSLSPIMHGGYARTSLHNITTSVCVCSYQSAQLRMPAPKFVIPVVKCAKCSETVYSAESMTYDGKTCTYMTMLYGRHSCCTAVNLHMYKPIPSNLTRNVCPCLLTAQTILTVSVVSHAIALSLHNKVGATMQCKTMQYSV